MKLFNSEGHKSRTMLTILIIASALFMLMLVLYIGNIYDFFLKVFNLLAPILCGIAVAFIFIPLLRRIEKLLSCTLFKKKPNGRGCRILSAGICVLIFTAMVVGFVLIMVPQLIDSIQSLIVNITSFIRKNNNVVQDLLLEYDIAVIKDDELVVLWENVVSGIMAYKEVIFDNAMLLSNIVYGIIYNLLVGIISAFYLLVEKDRFACQAKKMCRAIMRDDIYDRVIYWTRRTNSIFMGFLSGKIVDSLIIGILCFIGMNIFGFQYSLLISVVVGVTNVIPFFGPFIGAIPSTIILLIVDPAHALWFVLFILALQQLDGNIIGPYILGDYVGIVPFWIMFSIIVGGGLFGFTGMVLGVPVFAVLYAMIKAAVEHQLRKKGLPLNTGEYYEDVKPFNYRRGRSAKM